MPLDLIVTARWARIVFLAAAVCVLAPRGGEITYRVGPGNPLDSIAKDIGGDAVNNGVHAVSFSGYKNVGVFDMQSNSSAADTIVFRRDGISDSVIDVVGGAPFIRIRNWKGVLRIVNLAFRLNNSAAVLIDGNGTTPSDKPGTLILDSCQIFGADVSSAVIQWAADSNRHVEIKRSHIAWGRGAASSLSLQGPVIEFYNNVLNFSGTIGATATANFTFAYNTATRVQVDANGSFGTANYRVAYNLVTFAAGRNYLGLPTGPRYFMGLTNFNATGSAFQNNLVYQNSNWAGFVVGPFTLPPGNDSIPRYPSPADTTELWNWGLTGNTNQGFLAGDSARPDPFNVFPNDTSRTLGLPSSDTLSLMFRSSGIPRTLKPRFVGALPPDSSFPYHRFQWPNKQALGLGGPFQLTGMWVRTPSTDGVPALLAKTDTGNFVPQTEGLIDQLDSSLFRNTLMAATQFHAAFRCNTPLGKNVSPRVEMGFTASQDTLNFGSVDRPGRTIWAQSALDSLAPDLRFLGDTLAFATTAVPTPGSQIQIGTRHFFPPFRADSVKVRHKTTHALFPASRAGAVFSAQVPAAAQFVGHLIEHLSVPRGRQPTRFGFPWGSVVAKSDSGFQLQLDSVSRVVDTSQFVADAKPCALLWQGRGAGDSTGLRMKVAPDLDLWKIPLSGPAVKVVSAARNANGDSLVFTATAADSGAAFFPGLDINVPANVVFSGDVNGFRVEGLLSSKSGRMDANPLAVSDVDTLAQVRNGLFLGGVSVAKRRLAQQGNYALRLPIKPLDSANVRVWVYRAAGWQATARVFPAGLADTVHIPGLDSTVSRVLVVETIGEPKDILLSHVTDTAGGQATVTFDNTWPGTTRITSFKVEVIVVSPVGAAISLLDSALLGDPLAVVVDANAYHAFTVRYYIGDTLAGVVALGEFPEFKVSKASQEATKPPTLARGWQLVGLPFDGLVNARFTAPTSADTVDRREMWKLRQNGAVYSWDTVPRPDTLTVTRGMAVLFGGTRSYSLSLESPVAAPLVSFPLSGGATAGWKLIANPFPFPLRAAKVSSSLGAAPVFKRLQAVNAGGKRSYVWTDVIPAADDLAPFTGYAYFFNAGETLTFNPLVSPAPKPSIGAALAAVLRAEMEGVGAEARVFPANNGRADISALPAPGSAFDLRLGAGAGFWSKGVDWSGFAVSATVQAPQAGFVSLSARPDGFGTAAFPAWALWDSLSGKAYAGAGLERVPVLAGENRYEWVAGSPGFVEKRLGDLQTEFARIGPSLAIMRRGGLRLRVNLPAQSGGYEQIEVALHDAQGRCVVSRSLGRTASGYREFDFALPSLANGFFLCSVRAYAGGKAVFAWTRRTVSP